MCSDLCCKVSGQAQEKQRRKDFLLVCCRVLFGAWNVIVSGGAQQCQLTLHCFHHTATTTRPCRGPMGGEGGSPQALSTGAAGASM